MAATQRAEALAAETLSYGTPHRDLMRDGRTVRRLVDSAIVGVVLALAAYLVLVALELVFIGTLGTYHWDDGTVTHERVRAPIAVIPLLAAVGLAWGHVVDSRWGAWGSWVFLAFFAVTFVFSVGGRFVAPTVLLAVFMAAAHFVRGHALPSFGPATNST